MKYKYTHCIAYVARIPWLRFLRIDGLWWWRVLELDKTGPKGRMHTASASNSESHFNSFLLQNSTGWGQVRDFIRLLYILYIYITYIPKRFSSSQQWFLGAAQCGTKTKNPVAPGRGRTQEATNGTESIAALENLRLKMDGGSYQQLMGSLMFWTAGLCLWYVVKNVIEAPPSEKRGQFNQSSAGL